MSGMTFQLFTHIAGCCKVIILYTIAREVETSVYFAILPQLVKKVRSDFFDKLKSAPTGRFFYSHFLCRKNHSSPATSNTLAAMMAG